MKQLIILATQRCGSTMVCDDIAGVNVIGRPSEYFINVIQNIDKVSTSELKSLIINAIKISKTENGNSAIKIMSNHIQRIGIALKKTNLCSSESNEDCFHEFFSDAVFVRIFREDKVAQAVSRIVAGSTGKYHTVDSMKGLEGMLGKVSKNRDESNLTYSFNDISQEIKKIIKEEKYLDHITDKYQLKVKLIKYEDVVNERNYVNEIAQILGFNNITLSPRRLKKISGNVSKSWVVNYKNELLIQLEEKTNQLEEKTNQLNKKDMKIKNLLDNRWYLFGQMSNKRKIWTIAKVVSKKIKLYWLLQKVKNIFGK